MSSSGNTRNAQSSRSPYLPVRASVERVARLTERERLFRLLPEGGVGAYDPGQFFMAGLPGYGEAPFSVAAPANPDGSFETCIRAVGDLTDALHRLKKGDSVWLRGPFGRGFSLDELKGRDLLFIAGGIGMAPMRSLIAPVVASARSFGSLTLIYGAKSPDEFLFTDEIAEWSGAGLRAELTIDKPDARWKGRVGVVTNVIPELELKPDRTTAVVIGPPVMYKFVILALWEKKLAHDRILLSLERRMKCGLGKCGHCQINSSYVCQEGPVYKLSELKGLDEALG